MQHLPCAERHRLPRLWPEQTADLFLPGRAGRPGVACHFGVKSESTSINQTAPVNVKESRIKLTLPTGTDVRLNDKIIDKKNGYEYIAEIPHDVHGHHIFVYVTAKGQQRYL